MKKGSFYTALGIIVTFMFLWGGNPTDAPVRSASAIAEEFKTVGNYIFQAGRNIRKAEEPIERVGKKIVGIVREVTAYNVGVEAQTSNTPCIGASGRNLCELVARKVKVCAANFVPIGTILKIEAYGECIVLDRMHRRFAYRVDIAMEEDQIEKAREFGLQKRFVEAKF